MSTADFFVSYTGEDQSWADWVAWRLEADGHTVLIQAWDMLPGRNWVHRMATGVREAERVVVLLSEAYLASVWGSPDWRAAWRDDPLGERRKLVVLRVEDCPTPGALGSAPGEDLFGVGEGVIRRRLHDVVRGALASRPERDAAPTFPGGAPSFPGALPEIWDVPPRNPLFVGREAELALLDRAFRRVARPQVLVGPTGVGKSELVVEYAHRHSSAFDVVWWVPSAEPALVPDHLARLRRRLGGRRHDGWRSLIVFDGATSPLALHDHLLDHDRVVITTRSTEFGSLGRVVPVGPFDVDTSIALLRRRLPSLDGATAARFAEQCGGLPAVIATATQLAEQYGSADPAARLARLERAHPAAFLLVCLLARLAPDPVPMDLFTRHAELLPAPLADVAARPEQFVDVVGVLVEHSLVTRTADRVTLLDTGLREALRAREDHAAVVPALLAADVPARITGEPAHRPRWQLLLPHVLAACGKGTGVSPVCGWLLDRAATFLQTQGQLTAALELFERALAIVEVVYGPEHPDHATCATNLARALRESGRPEPAEALLRQALLVAPCWFAHNELGLVLLDLGRPAEALASLEAAGPCRRDPERFVAYLNNTGAALAAVGDLAEARARLGKSLRLAEQHYGVGDPEVAVRLHNLGRVLLARGRPAEAVELLRAAVEINSACFDPTHIRVGVSLEGLGTALVAAREHAEAGPLLERALEVFENAYGPGDHRLVPCMEGLSEVRRALG
ncbi:toll/interleukin-1 receptor domain-containing protein [Actinosynnema sp. NPDC020468]|uniref:tetratricopeptide repeat protein n=1 Tax=Actinosynnema sp. NPDC020468 TaxID=3154488 RepID=UPI0033D6DF60